MIYAEKDYRGRLTGLWRNIRPPWNNWTEYASIEEFESDLEIDKQERHENLHPQEE